MNLDARHYNEFRTLVYDVSGINLGNGKEALVSSRIGKRMRALGMDEFGAYLKMFRTDPAGEELVHLLDAISTNTTSFFREPEHFELVRELFSGWLKTGQKRFRIWSAASSTGEEPYTLAMTVMDALEGHDVDWKILATDISTRVLETASRGEYGENRMNGIPSALKGKYFNRSGSRGAYTYRIRDEVRSHLVFKRFNLSTPPFPMQGPLDLVLCRNVMIYFDNQVRTGLVNEIHRLLKPEGFLLVGHAESLNGIRTPFHVVSPSVYRKD